MFGGTFFCIGLKCSNGRTTHLMGEIVGGKAYLTLSLQTDQNCCPLPRLFFFFSGFQINNFPCEQVYRIPRWGGGGGGWGKQDNFLFNLNQVQGQDLATQWLLLPCIVCGMCRLTSNPPLFLGICKLPSLLLMRCF